MIEIKSLSLQLGPFSLSDIDLAVDNREYFVILGPTGAGKTIILECIAGLHNSFRKGEIWVEGNNVTSLPPEKREVGYVPQDYVLFPGDIYISLSKPPEPQVNCFRGIVAEIEVFSSLIRLRVKVGKNILLTELPGDIFQSMNIGVGQEIFVVIRMSRLRVHC